MTGSTRDDDMAMGVPSLVWFDRWSIVLMAAVGAAIVLALALQFRVGAPWLTGAAEAAVFVSLGVALVAVVGWGYTGMRFWAQMGRGEHLTRVERRRRAWIYGLLLGAVALVTVAQVLGAHNKLWLWTYVPAAALLALLFRLRPRTRVRTRRKGPVEVRQEK